MHLGIFFCVHHSMQENKQLDYATWFFFFSICFFLHWPTRSPPPPPPPPSALPEDGGPLWSPSIHTSTAAHHHIHAADNRRTTSRRMTDASSVIRVSTASCVSFQILEIVQLFTDYRVPEQTFTHLSACRPSGWSNIYNIIIGSLNGNVVIDWNVSGVDQIMRWILTKLKCYKVETLKP